MGLATGEAVLDADGVLHGWCWSPERPRERQVVEVLINERIAAGIVATRFREDLAARDIGDGYHGFVVPLTRTLTQSGPGCVISVRHRASGGIFWRSIVGELGLPAGLAGRMAGVEAVCRTFAQSGRLAAGRPDTLPRQFAAGLGAVGRHLGRAAPGEGGAFATAAAAYMALAGDGARHGLAAMAMPAVSVLLDAGEDARATVRLISAAAGALERLEAELMILDTGADAGSAVLPGLYPNLRYLAGQNMPRAVLRHEAAKAARGNTLLYLANDGTDFSAGLAELAAVACNRRTVVLPARLAERVMRLAPRAACVVRMHPAAAWSGVRLAISRADYLSWGHLAGSDAAMGLRAMQEGCLVIGWREPARGAPAGGQVATGAPGMAFSA